MKKLEPNLLSAQSDLLLERKTRTKSDLGNLDLVLVCFASQNTCNNSCRNGHIPLSDLILCSISGTSAS